MGSFIKSIFAASPEDPTTSLNPAAWLYDALGGGPTSSGMNINEKTAMRSVTVWRCVNLIANTIAALPLNVYKRTKEGRIAAPEHPLYKKLHAEPNIRHSSFTWRQLSLVPALLAGNGYSAITLKNGQVDQIIPIDSERVEVNLSDDGRLKYTITGVKNPVDQVEMLHFPGVGFDGIKGMSVISSVGKEAVGLALAIEEHTGRLHKNAAIARGAIEAPGALKPTAATNLISGVKKMLTNDNGVLLLDAGMKWHSLAISPVDAQTLEQRKFQIFEICALFGIPPWMIGFTEKSTSWGTGIEQQMIAFVTFVIQSWTVMMEQEFNRKLFSGTQYYCEFLLSGLMRGDSAARAAYYTQGIRNSFLKPNEVRKFENLPPDPDGDKLLADQTLIPIDKLGQEVTTNANE